MRNHRPEGYADYVVGRFYVACDALTVEHVAAAATATATATTTGATTTAPHADTVAIIATAPTAAAATATAATTCATLEGSACAASADATHDSADDANCDPRAWRAIRRTYGGRVVWFDARRGFGAIQPDSGDAEVSVHHRALRTAPGRCEAASNVFGGGIMYRFSCPAIICCTRASPIRAHPGLG